MDRSEGAGFPDLENSTSRLQKRAPNGVKRPCLSGGACDHDSHGCEGPAEPGGGLSFLGDHQNGVFLLLIFCETHMKGVPTQKHEPPKCTNLLGESQMPLN